MVVTLHSRNLQILRPHSPTLFLTALLLSRSLSFLFLRLPHSIRQKVCQSFKHKYYVDPRWDLGLWGLNSWIFLITLLCAECRNLKDISERAFWFKLVLHLQDSHYNEMHPDAVLLCPVEHSVLMFMWQKGALQSHRCPSICWWRFMVFLPCTLEWVTVRHCSCSSFKKPGVKSDERLVRRKLMVSCLGCWQQGSSVIAEGYQTDDQAEKKICTFAFPRNAPVAYKTWCVSSHCYRTPEATEIKMCLNF